MPDDSLNRKQQELENLQNNYSQLQNALKANVNEMFKESMPDKSSLDIYENHLQKLRDGIEKEIKARELQAKLIEEVTKKEKERIETLKKEIDIEKAQVEASEENKRRDEENAKKKEEQISQRINAINQLIDGNVKQGLVDFAKTFDDSGKLFGQKFSAWAQVIVKGIEIANKITERQAALNQTSILLGANTSNTDFYNTRSLEDRAVLSATLGAFRFNKEQQNQIIAEYGKTYDVNSIDRRENFNRIESIGAAQKFFGARGVDVGNISTLAEGAYIREGISSQQFNSQNFQQIMQAQQQSGLSWNKFINVLNQVEKDGRALGMTFQDSLEKVAKFGKEIDKGTISLGNLSVYERGISGAAVPQNAGLGAMLLQTGNLPSEAMRFADDPLALSGWLRANSSNKQVQKGIENMVRNEAVNAGVTSKEGLGEFFRLRYSQLGFSLDKKQYEALAEGKSLTGTLKGTQSLEEINTNLLKEAEGTAKLTSSMSQDVRAIWDLLKDAAILKVGKSTESVIKKGEELGSFVNKKATEWGANPYAAGALDMTAKSASYTSRLLLGNAITDGIIKVALSKSDINELATKTGNAAAPKLQNSTTTT